jgi:D-lactate dehydrogenase (cytochrome)
MTTHRIHTRAPREPVEAPPLVTDADTLRSLLEDAAHFPGGHAPAAAFPRTEGEVAALVRQHRRILPIGAQSSVTGGATPRGEIILSTAKLAGIGPIATTHVRVQPGVPILALKEALVEAHRYYPPAPTYDGAFVGGTIATNASGAATFKYGSTRNWVRGLTVVLASGDVLEIERGQIVAHPQGYFEVAGPDGTQHIPVPTYRMPDVAKRSAGYFAAPGMDLIDLFIGSEGTLGVVVEAVLDLVPALPATCLALVPCPSERTAWALVGSLRELSIETRRSGDSRGLDVSAIEFLDRRCLEMAREDGVDLKLAVQLPPDTALVLFVQIELAPGTTAAEAYEEVGRTPDADADETPLIRFCRILDEAGLFDRTELAVPGDRKRAEQFFEFRESAPEAVKRRIALAKERTGTDIEKTAADMIVPFEHFGDMMTVYRDGFSRRGLDFAIWGHVSDGNVHPNVLPRSLEDVRAGQEAILEFGRAVARFGGCPLAEHGVGRSAVKQALLRQLYGDAGVGEMRRVKAALDPEWKLSPGVLFPSVEHLA